MILAQFIRVLRADEDERQAELLFRILDQHRELVPIYWTYAPADLFSPRIASAWILNITLALKLSDLEVPIPPNATSPPTPKTVADHILPQGLRRTELSRGIQNQSSLIRHLSLLLLSTVLGNLGRILRVSCAGTRKALPEWRSFRQDLVDEVLRHVPDLQVIIAAVVRSRQAGSALGPTELGAHIGALRVLRDYLRYLGFGDARLDMVRILTSSTISNHRPTEYLALQLLSQTPDSRFHLPKGDVGPWSVVFQITGNPSAGRRLNSFARHLLLSWLRSFSGLDKDVDSATPWFDVLQLLRGETSVQAVIFLNEIILALGSNPLGVHEDNVRYITDALVGTGDDPLEPSAKQVLQRLGNLTVTAVRTVAMRCEKDPTAALLLFSYLELVFWTLSQQLGVAFSNPMAVLLGRVAGSPKVAGSPQLSSAFSQLLEAAKMESRVVDSDRVAKSDLPLSRRATDSQSQLSSAITSRVASRGVPGIDLAIARASQGSHKVFSDISGFLRDSGLLEVVDSHHASDLLDKSVAAITINSREETTTRSDIVETALENLRSFVHRERNLIDAGVDLASTVDHPEWVAVRRTLWASFLILKSGNEKAKERLSSATLLSKDWAATNSLQEALLPQVLVRCLHVSKALFPTDVFSFRDALRLAVADLAGSLGNRQTVSHQLRRLELSARRSQAHLAVSRLASTAESGIKFIRDLLIEQGLFVLWLDRVARTVTLDVEAAQVFAAFLAACAGDPKTSKHLRKLLDRSPSYPSVLFVIGSVLSSLARPGDAQHSQLGILTVVVDLASTLAIIHPHHPRCEILVESLAMAYRGTMHRHDQKIRSTLSQLEEAGIWVSNSGLGRFFSLSEDTGARRWDARKVFETINDFGRPSFAHSNPNLYDPDFLLAAASFIVLEGKTSWHDMIENHVVGTLVAFLSSEEPRVRVAAAAMLDRVFSLFDNDRAAFRERNQIDTLLESFRNAIVIEGGGVPRVPKIVTAFLGHALQIATRPAHELFLQVNKFFLQRPNMDLDDIPMLYELLYSSDDDHRVKRAFILNLLEIGAGIPSDYKLYQRRHVLEILMTLFWSPLTSQNERNSILKVMRSMLADRTIASGLLGSSPLIFWMLQGLQNDHIDDNIRLAFCQVIATALGTIVSPEANPGGTLRAESGVLFDGVVEFQRQVLSPLRSTSTSMSHDLVQSAVKIARTMLDISRNSRTAQEAALHTVTDVVRWLEADGEDTSSKGTLDSQVFDLLLECEALSNLSQDALIFTVTWALKAYCTRPCLRSDFARAGKWRRWLDRLVERRKLDPLGKGWLAYEEDKKRLRQCTDGLLENFGAIMYMRYDAL